MMGGWHLARLRREPLSGQTFLGKPLGPGLCLHIIFMLTSSMQKHKVLPAVMEASIFRKPYFTKHFVPALFASHPGAADPEVRMSRAAVILHYQAIWSVWGSADSPLTLHPGGGGSRWRHRGAAQGPQAAAQVRRTLRAVSGRRGVPPGQGVSDKPDGLCVPELPVSISLYGSISPSQPFLWRTWSTEFELARSILLSGQSKASADGGKAGTDVSGVAAAGGELFRKALAPLLEAGKANNVCVTSPWRSDVIRRGLVDVRGL
jgi:hypothetical protein